MTNAALNMDEVGLICPSTNTKLNIYFQRVTPAIAQRLLESNHAQNRKIKPQVVDSYVRQMERGLWKPDNGEGISISECGKLVNGQHRLHAIIQYGKTVTVLIISGVPENSIASIDDGIKRTLTDAMMINGKNIPNQSSVNGAITCLYNLYGCTMLDLHYESISGAKRNSTSELIQFYDSMPKFKESAHDFFTKFKYSKIAKVIPLGVALSMYYVFYDEHQEIVYSIFKSYETGIPMDNLREASPIYFACAKSRRSRELKIRIRPWEHIAMFLWVFAKSIEGKKVEKAPQMVWNWSNGNLIIQQARKKLKALDI